MLPQQYKPYIKMQNGNTIHLIDGEMESLSTNLIPPICRDEIEAIRFHEMMNRNIVSDINQKREQQITERLKECGFEFSNRSELIEFLKKRCTLEIHPNHFRRLLVDKRPIAEWYETISYEIKQDKIKYTIDIKCIAGLKNPYTKIDL